MALKPLSLYAASATADNDGRERRLLRVPIGRELVRVPAGAAGARKLTKGKAFSIRRDSPLCWKPTADTFHLSLRGIVLTFCVCPAAYMLRCEPDDIFSRLP